MSKLATLHIYDEGDHIRIESDGSVPDDLFFDVVMALLGLLRAVYERKHGQKPTAIWPDDV